MRHSITRDCTIVVSRRGGVEAVYFEPDNPLYNQYRNAVAAGGNFAIANRLLIWKSVGEVFEEVFGEEPELVYEISHNLAQEEEVPSLGGKAWVHRKGATRAFPAGHHGLKGTRFAETGHPILLPGNPQDGSVVMVAEAGAEKSCYSVNHGAGRAMGRKAAARTLDQTTVDRSFEDRDILTNCRLYPIDEAPAAYKDFKEVLRSVEAAGLASTVAKLDARFVIKDSDDSLKGAA